MAKPYFEEVDLKIDFPATERKILDYWYKKGVVKKYLTKNKSSKKRFSFLDGPITANNPMGVHHAWGRTYKDLWQRFYNMRGYRQRFQNGFDCQGLWVEVEVEKELCLKSKKDIENLVPGDVKASIAKFVELCRQRVFKYAAIQTEQSKRLGYFMDWDNSYYTLSDENNYMIWHFLKKCDEGGLIYKGRDSVPWCPRCGTAISQHEMLTEDYKEATHDSIYIKYPLHGKKNEFLLVWTTTPWTLPGNVAIAVDPKAFYVEATESVKRNKYYLNQFAAKRLGLEIEKVFKGDELAGLTYKSPFDNLDRVKKTLGNYVHRVVATDEKILPVSTEEGTGLVHVAPGAGSEDFQLGKKLNLPVVELIDEEATYIDGLGEFSGKNAKDRPEIILDFLKGFEEGKYLFDVVAYTHRYPACWRCKTELVWRVVDEWYIAMDKPVKSQKLTLRKQMIEVAKKIRWLPEFGLDRELDWLKNMHDWLISKKRYWGLALPIWECKTCGNFEVIGSKDDLKNKAVEGWNKFATHSPHRPWIDEVNTVCSRCGGISERISDVGNPWLDAGIVAFSTISADNKSVPLYWSNREEWRKWFPADFITESFPGQFKNWFYSLIAMSTVLEKEKPFKTVLGFATLLAEDGRPMHKSWGNMIEFNEGAEKIGVDVMRWMYLRQNPSENLLFGYKVADEIRRKFHLKLWNIYNFFVTYANLDRWKPKINSKVPQPKLSVLDRWILARLKEVVTETTYALEDYDAYGASLKIEEFVEDLSNWYIRRSRGRIGISKTSVRDAEDFYETSYLVLVTFTKMLAPFNPFISELIYKNLTKEESVHLESWPIVGELTTADKKLIERMRMIREIVEIGHMVRKKEGIPVRQPLKALFYSFSLKSKGYEPQEYAFLLKDELNVKDVYWGANPHGPVHKGHWVSETVSKSSGLGNLYVSLQTDITPELEEEAKTRELIRRIQQRRKELGVGLSQRIVVYNTWFPVDKTLVQKIKRATLAKNLYPGEFEVKVYS